MTALFLTLLTIVAAYGLLVLFSFVAADSLIFRPRTSSYRDGPRTFKIPADDGTPLTAVHLRASESICTLLYLHGNAEDLGDLFPHLEALQAHGLSVLAFDYRGYGTTPGHPSAKAVSADTAAVFRHMTQALGIAPDRIVVYGRSLGSGPGVELAVREPVRGLVLDGAFTSTFRVVTQVPLLPGDQFRNEQMIGGARCPVLVIHGTRDRTVPFSHGRALFAAAPEPKRNLWVEGAGHNDLPEIAGDAYWLALREFCASDESPA